MFACIAFFFLVVLEAPSLAVAQPAGILERAFFYNDIYHFVGHPYRSPSFGEMKSLTQPFTAQCSGLNRIIVPFYVREARTTGHLKFNLYRSGQEKTLLFSQDIDLEKLSPPVRIGTHAVDGVLHYLWFAPQADSKNKSYQWEILGSPDGEPSGTGIYLTRRANPQLQPVLVDGASQAGAYAAFYSYCRYVFAWDKIFATTADRLWREKYFVAAYVLLLSGLGVCLKKSKEL